MNISQVPTASSAARRVWGEANVCSTRRPGTDRRTDGRRSGSPALEDSEGKDSGRRSLGHAWMLVMEDAGPSPRTQPSPGGRRGARCLGGRQGCRAPGEGGGAGAAAPPPRTVLLPGSLVRPRLSPSRLHPVPGADSPAPGQRLFSVGSFLCQRVGRAGGARAGLDGDL